MTKSKYLVLDLIIIFLVVVDLIIVVYYTIYPLKIPFNILIFDLLVVLILIVEFIFRFKQAKNKKKVHEKQWFRTFRYGATYKWIYIPEVALFGLFRFIRFTRLLRLLRVIGLFKKSQRIFTEFFKKTHMDYAIAIFILILVASAFSLFFIEINTNSGINSLDDAFWYVIVTITTVGYGDISPQTEIGRIIGIVTIFTGVGFMSLLTASLATFFVNRFKQKEDMSIEEKIDNLEEQMNKKFDDMQSEIISLKEEGTVKNLGVFEICIFDK